LAEALAFIFVVVVGVVMVVFVWTQTDRAIRAIGSVTSDVGKIAIAKRLRKYWQRALGVFVIATGAAMTATLVVDSFSTGQPPAPIALGMLALVFAGGVFLLAAPTWFGYALAVEFFAGVDPRGEGRVHDVARRKPTHPRSSS